jgi:hypothetical protein
MYFGGESLLQGRNFFLMYLEVTLQGRTFFLMYLEVTLQGRNIFLMYLEVTLQRRIFPLQKASISKGKNAGIFILAKLMQEFSQNALLEMVTLSLFISYRTEKKHLQGKKRNKRVHITRKLNSCNSLCQVIFAKFTRCYFGTFIIIFPSGYP